MVKALCLQSKWTKFETHSCHSVVSLGKTLYGTLPCLVVLASSSTFSTSLWKKPLEPGECLHFVFCSKVPTQHWCCVGTWLQLKRLLMSCVCVNLAQVALIFNKNSDAWPDRTKEFFKM